MSETKEVQLKCDFCGNILKDTEKMLNEGIIFGVNKKIVSKNRLQHKFEGLGLPTDLCYVCSLDIRNLLEAYKNQKRKI